jgi:hypothetical protein
VSATVPAAVEIRRQQSDYDRGRATAAKPDAKVGIGMARPAWRVESLEAARAGDPPDSLQAGSGLPRGKSGWACCVRRSGFRHAAHRHRSRPYRHGSISRTATAPPIVQPCERVAYQAGTLNVVFNAWFGLLLVAVGAWLLWELWAPWHRRRSPTTS